MKTYLLIISLLSGLQSIGQGQWQGVISDYDIVGLGEETHGVETYYQEKQRLIEVLDSLSDGPLLILVESPLVLSVVHMLSGKDSDYHYHHTNTASNIDFFERFENLGFDIQEDCRYTTFSTYLIQEGYVDKSDSSVRTMDSLLSLCILGDNYQKDVFNDTELDVYLNAVDSLASKTLSTRTDDREKYFLELCFTNRKYLGDYLHTPTHKRYKYRIKYRDQKMAENLISLHNHYESYKTIVWAANSHIGKEGVMGKKWSNDGVKSAMEYLSVYPTYSIAIKGRAKKSDRRFYDQVIYLSDLQIVDDKYLKLNCD